MTEEHNSGRWPIFEEEVCMLRKIIPALVVLLALATPAMAKKYA